MAPMDTRPPAPSTPDAPADIPPDATVVLPCSAPALRVALAGRDMRALARLAGTLRVAGYHFEPAALAEALRRHGMATVRDAFGHAVAVQVCPQG